jgi:hypothetical protein
MNKGNRLWYLALGFVAGCITLMGFSGVRSLMNFAVFGSPIVCQSSFPRGYYACIYSRSGMGDQGISFVINDKTIFQADDFPGGDLKPRIFWDGDARHVTFSLAGFDDKRFDAEVATR